MDYAPGFRDTVGWSACPEIARAEQPHLRLIEAGAELMDALAPGLRGELARTLRADAVLREGVELLDAKLVAALARPARTRLEAERRNVGLLELAADRHELWLQAEEAAEAARRTAAGPMGRLQFRLLRRHGPAARRRADAVRIDPALAEVVDPAQLRTWTRAFFALAGPAAPAPERLELAPGGRRASFDAASGRLSIGLDVDAGTVFHELGHALETDNFEVMLAASAWRDARAAKVDADLAPAPLRTLCPGAPYGEDEVALEDHFVSPYVGKLYELFGSEVISTGLEHFVSGARMARLFEQDPEHFLLVLGALEEVRR